MSALAEAQIKTNFTEATGSQDSWMISPDAQGVVKYDSLLEAAP